MKTKIFTLVVSLIVILNVVKAQDIHFSKFYSAPLILNPANTTNYHGNWSVISNYRQQGITNYNNYTTATFAFDFPVYINKQRVGFGIIWINDKSADNTLLVNKMYLSSAYFVKISYYSYLHLGLQAGYVIKKVDFSGITFPDQFDMSIGYFNPDLPTEEILNNQTLSYPDLNWGLIWSYKKPTFTLETGCSMFHYNLPEESFSGNDFRLKPRYVGHVFVQKVIKSNVFIKPKLIYVNQEKASELLAGFDTGLLFPESKISNKLFVGIFFRGGLGRNPDAWIAKAGINYKSFDIALSYDYQIPGNLFYGYTENAFELSLSFKRKETNIKNKVIPCTVF